MKYKKELKNINKMAYPILLNYLLLSVFEILDKAIVGHYSVQGFAVIGIAAAPIYEITGALGILSSAFNIIAARLQGEKDSSAFETAFVVSRRLAFAIGFTFFMLSLCGGNFFFRKMYGMEGEALNELLSYFYPASVTVLLNMLIFHYSAYNRNFLNTRISFYSTAVSTVVNLFFDVTLVYGLCGMPQLGTAGAAWGSVLGLIAGLLVYQIPYCIRKREKKSVVKYVEKISILKNIFKLYPSLAGQEFLESTLFVLIISGVMARMGTQQMAVYSLLGTVGSMIELPIYAYASAAQTYALQSRASGSVEQAEIYLKSGRRITAAVTGIVSLLCYIWQMQIFGWIISDHQITLCAGKLVWWIFAMALARVDYQFYMGYLQGIGREKYIFGSAVISTIISSVGVIILGDVFGVSGIYCVIGSKYLILAGIYRKKIRLAAEEFK